MQQREKTAKKMRTLRRKKYLLNAACKYVACLRATYLPIFSCKMRRIIRVPAYPSWYFATQTQSLYCVASRFSSTCFTRLFRAAAPPAFHSPCPCCFCCCHRCYPDAASTAKDLCEVDCFWRGHESRKADAGVVTIKTVVWSSFFASS